MAPSILGLASAILGIPTITTFIQNLISALTRNSEYIENVQCTRNQLQEFEDEDLLGKMSILLTPTGYSDGSLNTIIPPYQVLPTELVTNGTFDTDSDWNKTGTWVILNGQASANANSTSQYVQQNFTISNGKVYKFTYEIIENTLNGNGASLSSLGGFGSVPLNSEIGYHTTYITASNQSATYALQIGVSSTCSSGSITIDNVSVKEVQEADFDFSRGSSATRVNEQGLVEDVQILSGELVQNGNFEQIGSELVTNGNFDTDSDWSLPSGSSISGGSLNFDGTQTGTINVSQTITSLDLTKIYKVTFTVSNYTAGRIKVKISNDAQGTNKEANGTYTEYLSGMSNKALSLTANVDFIGSIDNVSIKEVGQNWSLNDGAFFTANGVNLKHTPSAGILQNTGYTPLTIGNQYKLTYEITEKNAGGVKLNSAVDTTMDSSVGTHIKYFEADGTLITFSRTNSSNNDVTIDNISIVEVTDDTDLPRIDYSPYSGAGTCGHLLLEPQSTNIVTYSEDFRSNSNFNTNAQSSIFESGYLAPDGTLTATRINGFDGYYVALSNTGSGQSRSIYVKSGNGQIGNVNLLDPNYQAHSLFEVTNEWKRVELVGSDTWFYIVDGRGASLTLDDVIVWGLQQENLSYATSYIPTSGTTVTRSAETANNSGNADLFNDSEGVLYAEIAALADVAVNRAISISDGSGNNRVNILYSTSSNQIRVIVMVGGSTQFDTSYSVTSVKDNHKVALKYKANDFALWIDGIERATDTSGTIYPQNTLNKLAFNVGSGIFPFYGKTKALAVFKEALSNDELELLTGEGYNSFAALAAAYNYNVI